MDVDKPAVTVVIPTRNSGADIVPTIRSVLANTYPNFTLLVVDQSTDVYTRDALQPFLADPRCRYFSTETKGVSRSRNIGMSESDTPIVAYTDDDCEVAPDWVDAIAGAFSDPRVGLVFGKLVAGAHDWQSGIITTSQQKHSYMAVTLADQYKLFGVLEGCMAVRRTVWVATDGFDEELGVGAPLLAAEGIDLSIRALKTGYSVFYNTDIQSTNHGFYTWEQFRKTVQRDFYGTGAMCAKHLKLCHWSILLALAYLLIEALRVIAIRLLHEHKFSPSRVLYLIYGLAAGFRHPVDYKTGKFRQAEPRIA